MMRGLRARYHLLPDQDEDLPVGCVEPDSEGRPGWEGAPAAGAVPEEPCGLVLSTPSHVLRDRDTKELGPHLPHRLQQQPWSLLYCTARDGFSLRTLYRRAGPLSSPALLLIRDTDAQAFGAFFATAIHMSNKFYGTGETFLFSFSPELKVGAAAAGSEERGVLRVGVSHAPRPVPAGRTLRYPEVLVEGPGTGQGNAAALGPPGTKPPGRHTTGPSQWDGNWGREGGRKGVVCGSEGADA
uniref:TBC/LysM-associated domain containing 2 n=1 Tax=Cairina moschata TaxID=8855 RepID=A0A8C3GNS2_CAIMO